MTDNPYADVVNGTAAPGSDNPFGDLVNGGQPAPAPAAPIAAPADDVAAAIKRGEEKRKRQQFLETLQNSKDIIPERQAQAISVAQARGVPVGVAYKYLEDLAPPRELPDYDTLAKQAPYTAGLIADPIRGPVTFTDHEPLSEMEKAFKDLGTPAGYSAEEFRRNTGTKALELLMSNLQSIGKKTPEESAVATQQNVQDRAAAVTAAENMPAQQQAMEQGAAAGFADFEAQRGNMDAPDPMALPKPYADARAAEQQRAIDAARKTLDVALKNPVTEDYWRNLFDNVVTGALSMVTSSVRRIGAQGDIGTALLPDAAKPLAEYARFLPAPLNLMFTAPSQMDEKGRGPITRLAAGVEDLLSKAFPGDVTRQGDFGTQVASGAGSMATFATFGSIARALGFSASTTAGILGALSQGGSNAKDAQEAGASPLVQLLSTYAGDLSGATESLVPLDRMLAGFPEAQTWLEKIIDIGLTAAKEGTQETSQQLISDAVPVLTYDKARDIFGNAFYAGLVGMITGGGMSALTTVAVSNAERNAALITKIGEMAQKAKVAEIAPKILEEHIGKLKEAGVAPDHVTASTEAIDTLFQEIGPELAGQQFPETVRSLQEARTTGAEVTIPTEELVRLGKLKGYGNFASDVRVGDTMTLNEAVKLRSKMDTFINQQDLTKLQAQEDSPVYTAMRDQLVKNGNSPEVASALARFYEAFTGATGGRAGMTSEEIARRYPIFVTNTTIAAEQMGPMLDALRAEASSSAGPKMEVSQTTKQGVTSTVRSYEIANPLGGDAPETVKVITRSNGDAIIQRAGKDDPLIDISNMLKAGFSPEKAVAISLGDHPDGMEPDVSKVRQVPVEGQAVAAKSDPGLNSLRSQLAAAGIKTADLGRMSNEQVAQALAERTMSQDTSTPEFKTWFGSSKVVDEQGKPIVVYHGTGQSFDSFKPGSFFTASPDLASGYGEGSGQNIVPAYLSIKNPASGADVIRVAKTLPGWDSDYADEYPGIIFNQVPGVMEALKKEGFDGAAFEDGPGGMSDAPDAPTYVAFDPTQIKSAIGNRGTFDANDPSILNQDAPGLPRGSITFGPGRERFDIVLTKNANLSTFIHELGHYFLEVLQDLVARGVASPQQVADLKTLKKWMGLKETDAIDRNGHEKFARGIEQHTMEGKAPSLALHSIFQKFKAWMIFVYKRLANVRGDLNDEIRAVMDRLVASDAAIAEARAQVGWRGAPLSQKEVGLDDAGYKAYVAEWIKANDAQAADADARIMLEAARELKQTWTDEKTKVTKQVEEELAQTRGWKAWKLLQDGEGLEEFGRTVMKIDPDSIPKEWRRDTAGMTAPVDQGGQDLDVVAEQLGFDTGEQMLQAIGGAKLAQKAIPARVRQIMVERHGEMDSAQLAQEAMKAVHNTPTMDVLLTEFRALAGKAGFKVGKDTARMVKAAAEERVAKLTQRQLRPDVWRRAEVKAAEEAGKLAAQGKDMDAALAKRRQLMAAAMAKASLEAQDRIGAIKDYLATFTTNRRRAALGKAGEAYLDQVDQILEAIQFKDVSLKAIKARQGLSEFLKEQEAAGEPVFVSDETRNLLGRRNYTEMTLEELSGVYDAVKNLWTVAKELNTLRKGAEKIALEKALADITAETDATLPEKKRRDHLNPSKIDRMMEGLSRYHAGNLKMEFVLDWLGKTAHSLIYQPVSDAAYESWKLHKELTAPFMDKLRSMPREQKKRWNTKRQFLNYPMPLKGANIWAIALNMGNAGNKEKMLAGYGWTESQVMAELNTFMTKEDWDLAQETWDTIDKMWPKMSAVVKKATGLEPPKVEATEIQTPYGIYKGGYFPVVYDRQIDAQMDDRLDSSISPEEMFSKRFTAFVIDNGFTKGRTKVTGKLLFSPDVIADHLGEVIHYATHYEAVKQADKIIRAPAFKALVKGRLGDAVYSEMKQWLKDVATNTTRSDRQTKAGDWALRWARNSAQLTSLGLNIKSALKQPLGIVATLDAIKAKHLAIGIKEAWLSPYAVQNWKEAFSKSKELGPLVKSYDRDLAAISRAYADSIGNRAGQATYMVAFMPISIMQSVANVAAWRGAYSQATEQGMSEADAVAFADKIVRTTQGSGALKDLSGMQRGGEANKFFTMFYSYFSVLYNRMADVQVRETGMKNLHRKVGRYTVLLLMGELLNSLFDDAWDQMFPPDKKRQEDETPFLVRLALNTVDSAINTLPVARDAYAAMSAIIGGTQVRTPPALGGVAKAISGAQSLKSVVWDGKDLTRAKARNIAALAGLLTNQPIYGVYRAIDDVFGQKMFDE